LLFAHETLQVHCCPRSELSFVWQAEMSQYLKLTLGVKQMVTNGNEGYRAKGVYDSAARIDYPYTNWMNSGLKGALNAWHTSAHEAHRTSASCCHMARPCGR